MLSLIDVQTGSEILYLLARIKGYSRAESNNKVKQMLKALGISNFGNQLIK
jgi:ABC-type multidrug transport system ATPase subunit